ncbi:hypothetical protein LINGRAHAP2_LOCUS24840, partial [Linum grandiflorum]
EAYVDQARVIQSCLDEFCHLSDQEVSRDKSHVYFLKNVSPSASNNICRELGMSKMSDLGRYLGISMIHGRGGCRHFQYILDCLDARLSSWKVATLSLAGRVTLVISVLNVIPAYAMQTCVLPIEICEKLTRRFEVLCGVHLKGLEKYTFLNGRMSKNLRRMAVWV